MYFFTSKCDKRGVRASLYPFEKRNLHFKFEGYLFTGNCHVQLRVGAAEDSLQFTLALPRLFSFWLTACHVRWIDKITPPSIWGRVTGASWFEGCLSVSVWSDEDQIKNDGLHFYFRPADMLFGTHDYSERTIYTERLHVHMPEGDYPAKARVYVATWKRPRWPVSRSVRRVELEMEKPIPFPGKGENSHDQGMDATHSFDCVAHYPTIAALKLAEDIKERRKKYG